MTAQRFACALALVATACSGSPKPKTNPVKPDAETRAAPLPPVTDDALVGARVAAVELRGLERIGESRARLAIALRPGDEFDRSKIRESLRKLMTINGIADARAVAYRVDAQKIGVAFVITEAPRITAIEVSGNDSLSNGELLKLSPIEVGQPVDPSAAQRAAMAMKERYAEAGYSKAEIEWKADPRGVVTFAVTEGPRVSIAKISFGSTRALTEARLNSILVKASPENTVGGVYLPANFEAGLLHITSAYYDIGHINVKVGPVSVSYPTPETIAVAIPVTEGPQFKLGKLSVGGKLAAPARQYLRQVKIRRGQVFSRSAVKAAIEKLTEFHKSKAKGSSAVVTPLTDVDLENKKVDIKFDIGT